MFHAVVILNSVIRQVALYSGVQGKKEQDADADVLVNHLINTLSSPVIKNLSQTYVAETVTGLSLFEVISVKGVDYYTLFEKAVLYQQPQVIHGVLQVCHRECNHEEITEILGVVMRLSAFLGEEEAAKALLLHEPHLVNVTGGLRLQTPHGRPSDKLYSAGYITKNTHSSCLPKSLHRLHWARTHVRELPLMFAVCADQLCLLKLLWNPDQEQHLLQEAMSLAWTCASYNCLRYLLDLQSNSALKNDNKFNFQSANISLGKCLVHGQEMVDFVIELGLEIPKLDYPHHHINGRRGSRTDGTTSLHVFYNSLSRHDMVLMKYSSVYTVTCWLLDQGVNPNLTSHTYHSHGAPDTCLHILMEQVNITFPLLPYETHFHEVAEAQQRYDNDLARSVGKLLAKGFDLLSHGESLVERLCWNRKHLQRWQIQRTHTHLSRGGYGMKNILQVLQLLYKANLRLYPRRQRRTALLCFLDNLRSPEGAGCVFGSEEATNYFILIVEQLLLMGDNPNAHLPASDFSSQHGAADPSYPALFFFLDIVLKHWNKQANMYTSETTLQIRRVVQLLCTYGSRLQYVRRVHGVHTLQYACTPLVVATARLHIIFARLTVIPTDNVDCVLRLLFELTSELVQWQGELRASTGTLYLPGPSNTKYILLYQVLLLGLRPLTQTGASFYRSRYYMDLLNLLLSATPHQQYYSCLWQAWTDVSQILLPPFIANDNSGPKNRGDHTSGIRCNNMLVEASLMQIGYDHADQNFVIFCRDILQLAFQPRSLRHLSRLSIYHYFKSRHKERITNIDMPPKLKDIALFLIL